MVDARDAIYKEFLFTNFNQVCMHVYQGEQGKHRPTKVSLFYGL